MLQRSPYFEQPTRTPTADELPEIRKLCSLAAASIEEFQTHIVECERAAQNRCICQENLQRGTKLEWAQWVKWLPEDSREPYIDAVFKQSVVFSKFPATLPADRARMMSCAAKGFRYCMKMWRWLQERGEDVSENLQLAEEMLSLLELRVSQL